MTDMHRELAITLKAAIAGTLVVLIACRSKSPPPPPPLEIVPYTGPPAIYCNYVIVKATGGGALKKEA
jgi:hypothetical protein